MNPRLVSEIVQLALSLGQSQLDGKISQDAAVGDTLFKIVQKSVLAYEQHTGEVLDTRLIHVEDPI